ncbi:MAG: hypothetical protein OHK0031_03310 [Anaerolineales bacterium]
MPENESSENNFPQVINLHQTSVESLRAEMVRATQSDLANVTAAEVEMNTASALSLQAEKVQAQRSLFGLVNANSVEMNDSALALARCGHLHLQGKALALYGESVQAGDVSAGLLAGRNVQAVSIRAGLVLGGEIHGPVETLMDARQAALTGVIGGVVVGLILLAGRLLFGKKR